MPVGAAIGGAPMGGAGGAPGALQGLGGGGGEPHAPGGAGALGSGGGGGGAALGPPVGVAVAVAALRSMPQRTQNRFPRLLS